MFMEVEDSLKKQMKLAKKVQMIQLFQQKIEWWSSRSEDIPQKYR